LSWNIRGIPTRVRAALYPSSPPADIDPATAALFIVAFVPLVAVVAGALRALLGIGLALGYPLALVPWFLLMSVLFHRFRPRGRDLRRALAIVFAVAIPVGLSIWSLDNGAFAGLPSTGGGDAGNHVMLQQRFLSDQPKEYVGFVAFYATTWIPEALFHSDVFEAFRAAFYVVPIVVVLAGVLAVAVAHSDVPGAAGNGVALAVAVPVFLTALWGALLPSIHRYQGDGFYPQVFALVTLCLSWLLWGLVDAPVVRAVVLVVNVGLYRFSYGLNLGDFAFAAAILLLLDVRLARTWLAKAGVFGVILALIGAGVAALVALYPLHAEPGGVIPARTEFLLRGVGLASFALLATSRAPPFARRFGSRLRRLMDFAAAFGIASMAIEVLYLATNHPPSYYFFKHGFHPAVLAICAVCVVGAVALGDLSAAARRAAWPAVATSCVPLVACAMAFMLLFAAMGTYRDSFQERARGRPPWQTLLTLWDVDAVARIGAVLRERSKSFGGYLTPLWAEANFTNAAFGHWRGFAIYGESALTEDPGYCVFWQATKEDIRSLENAELGGKGALLPIVSQLERGEKQCSDYAPRWNPAQRRHLCHRCF
jgi:hypothetical protein